MTTENRTLFERVWDSHVVAHEDGSPAVLYIDSTWFTRSRRRRRFRRSTRAASVVAERTVATMDHSTPTLRERLGVIDSPAREQLGALEKSCENRVRLHAIGSPTRGIVARHRSGARSDAAGMTIVCGDSHTSTHGAFGALAFGIGTSEVEHVLATQCLLQQQAEDDARARQWRAPPRRRCQGPDPGAHRANWASGGRPATSSSTRADAIAALDMEGRMTTCNMSD